MKTLTLAQAVICGSIFAGCPEAPGQILEITGKLYKQYRGMGSLAAANLARLREKARHIRVSPAGQREAGTHDIVEVKTGRAEGSQ